MICAHFERWLDDGRPDRHAPVMTKHAALCTLCQRALGAAIAVEEAVTLESAATPGADFNDSVMRQIHARQAPLPLRQGTLPWWARLAAEPLISVSVALGATMALNGRALWIAATRVSAHAMSGVGAFLGGRNHPLPALTALTSPAVMLALVLAITPSILWMSWQSSRSRNP
jgi:hypothetical protein